MLAPDLARNRWPGLLAHFGVDPQFLVNRHGPCPVCGGRDRFRFDDKDGRGTFFCSKCGSGDGFRLLELIKGWPFKETAEQIKAVIGTIPAMAPTVQPSEADKLQVCRRIWGEATPVTAGDPVSKYIEHRCGLIEIPPCIRFHPALSYRHADGSRTTHPAMVTRVTGGNGNGVAIHRTYLNHDGDKAELPTVKKIVGTLPASSAVRLFPVAQRLGLAEGIETALSAFVLFGVPTWAAVTAGGMEKWTPPEGTERVIVFGDNDLSGTGQAAAWALAKRLIAGGIYTEVKVPEMAGTDWNDFAIQQRGGV